MFLLGEDDLRRSIAFALTDEDEVGVLAYLPIDEPIAQGAWHRIGELSMQQDLACVVEEAGAQHGCCDVDEGRAADSNRCRVSDDREVDVAVHRDMIDRTRRCSHPVVDPGTFECRARRR